MEIATFPPLEDLLCREFLATLCSKDSPTTDKYFFWYCLSCLTFSKRRNYNLSSGRLVTLESEGSDLEACFVIEDRKEKQVLVKPGKAPLSCT